MYLEDTILFTFFLSEGIELTWFEKKKGKQIVKNDVTKPKQERKCSKTSSVEIIFSD